MSNYTAIEYDDASPILKAVYDEYKAATGKSILPNWLKYLGSIPHITKSAWELVKAATFESQLSPLLQELVFYAVAYHRTAPYCKALHGNNLVRMTPGLTLADLDDIVAGNTHGYLPRRYEIAAETAGKLALAKCALDDKDFAILKSSGFTHAEAMEITLLVSVAVFFNTYTFAADLPKD